MQYTQEKHECKEPQELHELQELLRPCRAAAMLGVTPETLRAYHRAGVLFAKKTVGGQLRVPVAEIERLLKRTSSETYADTEAARIKRSYPLPTASDEAELKSFTDEVETQTASALPDLRTLFKQEEDEIL